MVQLQTVFESMCRCFGHEEDLDTGSATNSAQGIHESSSQISAKKRASRLELKDKQWDELFEKTQKSPSKQSSPTKRTISTSTSGASGGSSKQRKKKPEEVRDDIFRMKAKEDASNSAQGFARLWNPYMALCFATPVRGASEEVAAADETDMQSDTATLNTNEDTIASTVYFENKYSHLTETRPPMPLFNQFKIGNEKDEIRNVMNSDSHSSVNMIRLLAQNNNDNNNNTTTSNTKGDDEVPDVTSTDSSSRESSKMRPNMS
ncbi:unnamed protein product [Cylindrotheca closterium]|uniref:Uncharacterized protein n=1 Tax=Cylindrotheca closterium TaxID=2856 RepID=A0AAD2PWZ9_9STRA|nr:unnamed protein product [Cylindrotheca closterium]